MQPSETPTLDLESLPSEITAHSTPAGKAERETDFHNQIYLLLFPSIEHTMAIEAFFG